MSDREWAVGELLLPALAWLAGTGGRQHPLGRQLMPQQP
jgi:hypothetical protein